VPNASPDRALAVPATTRRRGFFRRRHELDYDTPLVRPDLNTAHAAAARPPARTATRVVVEDVGLRFGDTAALHGVSLAVAAREILCLLGPSGSGKSSLLRLIAGIERPSAGRIIIDGVEVSGPRRFVEPEHRRLGMVFQDYALFPHLSVRANVAFGLQGRTRGEVDRLVTALLERLDLDRHAASYPHMLSGGERQRVALARAMAPGPRVLLMDEPFSSLDARLRDRVREHTLDFLRETGTTTVLVTHDADEALRIADRIVLLREGQLVQCGRPEEIYTQPATLFAARSFGHVNELHGTCRAGRVDTPLGSFAAPHLAERTSAAVCIRPQHLRLAPRPSGIPARVVRKAYLGEIDHVEIAVEGLEAPLTLRAFGRTHVKPDDRVYLTVHPHDVLIVAREEAGGRPAFGGGQPS
jgi:iron(III) transport system ATP-binding protein